CDATALAEGDHTITAVQTDIAGNQSAPATRSFAIDTTAPAAPAITSPTDGGITGDATPQVSGTGEAGSTVTLVDEDDNPVCTATVQSDGTWTCTPSTALGDGEHTLTATQTDAAGNTSPGDSVTFAVDATAPTAPAITAPADGVVTNNATPTIAGTAEPLAD